MANLALWASVVNVISWLLTPIPGFLLSPWSSFELVTIPLSAGIALVAGLLGIRRANTYGTGSWRGIAGLVVGLLNAPLIYVMLAGISAMVRCC